MFIVSGPAGFVHACVEDSAIIAYQDDLISAYRDSGHTVVVYPIQWPAPTGMTVFLRIGGYVMYLTYVTPFRLSDLR